MGKRRCIGIALHSQAWLGRSDTRRRLRLSCLPYAYSSYALGYHEYASKISRRKSKPITYPSSEVSSLPSRQWTPNTIGAGNDAPVEVCHPGVQDDLNARAKHKAQAQRRQARLAKIAQMRNALQYAHWEETVWEFSTKHELVWLAMCEVVIELEHLCTLWDSPVRNAEQMSLMVAQTRFWRYYSRAFRKIHDDMSFVAHEYRRLHLFRSDAVRFMDDLTLAVDQLCRPFYTIDDRLSLLSCGFLELRHSHSPTSPNAYLGRRQFLKPVCWTAKMQLLYAEVLSIQSSVLYDWMQVFAGDSVVEKQPLFEYILLTKSTDSLETSHYYREMQPLRNTLISLWALRRELSLLVQKPGQKRHSIISPTIAAQLQEMRRRILHDVLKSKSADGLPALCTEVSTVLARSSKVKAQRGFTEDEIEDLQLFMRRQRIIALANIIPGPSTKEFDALARSHGWVPPEWLKPHLKAPIDAPRPPATKRVTSHRDDSLSDAAAFQAVTATQNDEVNVEKPLSHSDAYAQNDSWLDDLTDIEAEVDEDKASAAEDTLARSSTSNTAMVYAKARVSTRTVHDFQQPVIASLKNPGPGRAGRERTFQPPPSDDFGALAGADEYLATSAAAQAMMENLRPPDLPASVPREATTVVPPEPEPVFEVHSDHDFGALAGDEQMPISAAVLVPSLSTHNSGPYPRPTRRGTSVAVARSETFDSSDSDEFGALAEDDAAPTRTWSPSHGIAFKPTARASSPAMLACAESDARSTYSESCEEDTEDAYVPLTFQMPEEKLTEAQNAPQGSLLSFWSYQKYKSPTGESITMHYCKSKETSEKAAQWFVNEPVLGCDIEWKSNVKDSAGLKSNVSLIQIACENRIALFHIALHKGSTPDEILAPTLKQILSSADILKCGVNIKGDYTRMQKHLGIEPVSLFELSHLYRLVEFGVTNRRLVNRKLVSLAVQAQQYLGLPLYKGDERTSDWSQALNMEQCKYAADDAYASYRIFEALKEKWYALDPRPPFPACAELGLPIQLAPLPESDTSESSEDDVEELASEIRGLEVASSNSKDESDEAFGENIFEDLSEDELTQLEHPTGLALPGGERAVSYPTLSSEIEIKEPNTFFVGRIGLQPRLRTSSGLRASATEPCPESADNGSALDQDLDDDEDYEASDVNVESTDDGEDGVVIEATRWAQEIRVSAQPSRSGKGALGVPALRSYYLWEHKKLDVKEISVILRDKPLKSATVAAYIAECIQFGNMPFGDANRLLSLNKELPRQARGRYWRIRKMAEDDGQASWR